jgi:hypothetical protein
MMAFVAPLNLKAMRSLHFHMEVKNPNAVKFHGNDMQRGWEEQMFAEVAVRESLP